MASKRIPDTHEWGLSRLTVEVAEGGGIHTEHLIKLNDMGFKLVPLNEDGRPAMLWTLIYDNPYYWTHEKLTEEAPKFKNVATCFGRTHLEDAKGNDLYLNCLDVDSEGVYKILFDLENHGRQYSFIAEAIKNTFVNKTRKPDGYQIFWFSHKLDQPITSKDCKPGLEFEIKTGKAGLCTLPGSTHRDDHNFRYKNYGQETIIISDDMYDKLLELLESCLEPKRGGSNGGRNKSRSYHDGERIELDDADIQVIAECIRPYYKKGRRHPIVFGLCGLLHKSGVSKDSTIALVETISKGDNEHDVRKAVSTVEETFEEDVSIVAGSRYLSDALAAAAGDSGIAKGILDKIFRLIGKGDPVQWLTHTIMKEYIFKTATDNEEIFCYDNEKGVYEGAKNGA